MKINLSYSSDCWDEDGNLVDPWNDNTVDPRTVGQTVVIYAEVLDEALDDQTIMGSTWEVCDGMAYAVLMDYGTLADDLRSEGYKVRELPDTYPVDRGE